jgi:hypothetical protein
MKRNSTPVAGNNGSPNPDPDHRTRSKRSGPRVVPGTREANKLAIAILDVLAGARLPVDAAQAVGVSLPRYYQLEQRALDAIVKACEPRSKGPAANAERQRRKLERQVARLTQECARQQALVRAAQRTIGLTPPSARPATGKTSGKSRQRRPSVRALRASRRLGETLASQETALQETAATVVGATPPGVESLSPIPVEGGSSS